MAKASNILLTGTPGIGKTTAIRKTLKLLEDVKVGGFLTEAIEEAGKRTGSATCRGSRICPGTVN